MLCRTGSSGCNFETLSGIVGPQTVPWFPPALYHGEGEYPLMGSFLTGPLLSTLWGGVDPIMHSTPKPGIWINDTIVGHMFHEGSAVVSMYEQDGAYWLYAQGRGTGNLPGVNGIIGGMSFGSFGAAGDIRRGILIEQSPMPFSLIAP